MFLGINLKAINLLREADLNENLLLKADLAEKSRTLNMKKIIKKIKPYMKMDKKIVKVDDTEIQEYKFHRHNSPISINDIDINEIVVSNKLPLVNKNISLFHWLQR